MLFNKNILWILGLAIATSCKVAPQSGDLKDVSGITNFGATCYHNSAMAMLSQMKYFKGPAKPAREFDSDLHKKSLDEIDRYRKVLHKLVQALQMNTAELKAKAQKRYDIKVYPKLLEAETNYFVKASAEYQRAVVEQKKLYEEYYRLTHQPKSLGSTIAGMDITDITPPSDEDLEKMEEVVYRLRSLKYQTANQPTMGTVPLEADVAKYLSRLSSQTIKAFAKLIMGRFSVFDQISFDTDDPPCVVATQIANGMKRKQHDISEYLSMVLLFAGYTEESGIYTVRKTSEGFGTENAPLITLSPPASQADWKPDSLFNYIFSNFHVKEMVEGDGSKKGTFLERNVYVGVRKGHIPENAFVLFKRSVVTGYKKDDFGKVTDTITEKFKSNITLSGIALPILDIANKSDPRGPVPRYACFDIKAVGMHTGDVSGGRSWGHYRTGSVGEDGRWYLHDDAEITLYDPAANLIGILNQNRVPENNEALQEYLKFQQDLQAYGYVYLLERDPVADKGGTITDPYICRKDAIAVFQEQMENMTDKKQPIIRQKCGPSIVGVSCPTGY